MTLSRKKRRSTKITETVKAVKRQGSNLRTRFSSTKTITYCKINMPVKSMLLCKIDILLYSKISSHACDYAAFETKFPYSSHLVEKKVKVNLVPLSLPVDEGYLEH